MKRHTKSQIAGTLLVAAALFAPGCAFVTATVPMESADASAPAGDSPGDRAGEPERPDELENWSRLSKEGREHLIAGRYSMAEQSLLEAFRLSRQFRKSDIRSRVSFGNLERLAQRYRGAQDDASARRVLSIIAIETQDLNEYDYPQLSDRLIELGALEEASGNFAQAGSAYRRALELRIGKSGANSAALIEVHQKLASVEILLGRTDLAVEQASRALELAETHIGPSAPEMVSAMLHAANAYQYAGRYPEAERLYRSALEAQRAIGSSSFGEAMLLNGLGHLSLKMDRLDDAATYVDHALSIVELLKLDGIERAMILDTKAQILAAEGDNASAERLFDEVMLHVDTASPGNRLMLYESYESFLMDQNRFGEARAIRDRIEQLSGDRSKPEAETDASRAFEAPRGTNPPPVARAKTLDTAAPPSAPQILPTEPQASWDE